MIKRVECGGTETLAVTLPYDHPDDITHIQEGLDRILKSALLNEFAFENGVFNGNDVVETMELIKSMDVKSFKEKGGKV